MKKVTMYDLGQSLSKVMRVARIEPVLVCKYAQPFVWIVPYGACIQPESLNRLIPDDHPLRVVRFYVDKQLEHDAPSGMRVTMCGTAAIPAEMLFRAVILQVLYAIAEPTQLYRQLGYNLLFRWFIGLDAWQALPQEEGFVHALRSMHLDESALQKAGNVVRMIQPHLQGEEFRHHAIRIREWLAHVTMPAVGARVDQLAGQSTYDAQAYG